MIGAPAKAQEPRNRGQGVAKGTKGNSARLNSNLVHRCFLAAATEAPRLKAHSQ